jgi:cytoplasmic iron level regulating protein YaaA (DUF328/UPF0246 family)
VLVILPPSETKRDGGVEGSSLDLGSLSYQGLAKQRRTVLAATRSLASNAATMAAALKLGPNLGFEVTRNRELRRSATMPAIDRYTGVLYDALGATSLDETARQFLFDNVAVHSAMFGLVSAADPIPAYRLSHDSRLPGAPLRQVWAAPISDVLASEPGLILDLRSQGYVELGPVPATGTSAYLRVVSEGADGRVRALNHFNKKGKGLFTRALAEAAIDHPDAESLIDWATSNNIDLRHGAPGELQLLVEEVVAPK